MKQNLRLGDSYCLKRIPPFPHIHLQYALKKRNSYAENSRTSPACLRTFFPLSPAIYYESTVTYLARTNQNLSQNSDTGYSWPSRRQDKGRRKSGVGLPGLRKAGAIPCVIPPSLTLPSGPIPICPAYTSVKSPKSGTLAKGKRLHSGRKAYTDRSGIADGADRDATGVCFGSASELNANSEPPRFALDLFQPNQGTTKSKPRPNQGTTKLRSHLQECPERGWSVARPSTTWDWFEYGMAIVRLLLGCASAFSRSVVEGFPKPSRTIVEALSKDCRTSLEQQSNTGRRNFEESCVWTHAKAPARSGLGLALGLTLFLLLGMSKGAHAQTNVQQGTLVDSMRPLQIGDSIPEALWHLPLQVANHPPTGGKDTITLNDYRDKKLIVLDFWATWCKPCLLSLAKLDTIQATLDKGDLAVLPVLVYDYPKNLPSFAERRGGWPWEWPTVVNDTLLNKVVLARYLTGFGTAWIAEGRLLAVPHPKAMTRENILRAMRREPLSIQNRTELPLTN
ncbi:TlpA disulfide reductase family protein [Parapedobacter defluvii]|uniref:TlpA disulfide reductase family protein n=1 Tax=Parapedobacter defluvii TaxID=2045106 RepID=UPI001669F1D8|nr:TlpA disulfide reductase family protein [Parapedobacter defluvii]